MLSERTACQRTRCGAKLPPMPKIASRGFFVCSACGFQNAKWLGKCPNCSEWNSLQEGTGRQSVPDHREVQVVPYRDVEPRDTARILTRHSEFDRVLGGGIVPGSLVMLGGEPGVGKSTLLLQISDSLSRAGQTVFYVAGEESIAQIKMRGQRLEIEGQGLLLVAETSLESVMGELERRRPDVLIVDSVQTLRSSRVDSAPGSTTQIRECADALLRFAKRTNTPVFLIGHITKDGSLAGPKTLEHVVDVVLYFEGDKNQQHKIIRAVKNRFGPTNELGVFEMTGRGLIGVENPSRLFLSEHRHDGPGSVVLCAMEGSRPVLVELQALVSNSSYGTARRMSNVVDRNRLNLILAMLEKRLQWTLAGSDVYVNAVGGLTLTEPAVDLALVTAIVSSYRDRPVPGGTVVCGEVGLAGEVRPVGFAKDRVKESLAMGFGRIILPQTNLPLEMEPTRLEILGVSSVAELVDVLWDSL